MKKLNKVRFYLRSKGAISLRLAHLKQPFQVPTGLHCDPEQWDKKTMRPKPSYDQGISTKLNSLEQHIYTTLQKRPETPHDLLKEIVFTHLGKKTAFSDRSLFRNYMSFRIVKHKAEENWSVPLSNKMKALRSHIEAYDKDATFEDVDKKWMDGLVEYWLGLRMSQNTINGLCGQVKQYFTEARVNHQLHEHDWPVSFKRPPLIKTINRIRCTPDMLETLNNYPLKWPRHQHVRDAYIIGATTGLRFGDWFNIDKSWLFKEKGHTMINILTTKTLTPVYIPVMPLLDKKLKELDYKIKRISNQKFNTYIKEVFEIVFPEERFFRVWSEGRDTLSEMAYIKDYVSSHSCRRTFATNMYELDPSLLPVIQMILGHSEPSQTLKYMSLDNKKMVTDFMDRFGG